MSTTQFVERLNSWSNEQAFISSDQTISYKALVEGIEQWLCLIDREGIPEGAVVSLEGDYCLDSVAGLFALWLKNCVVIPLAPDSSSQHDQFCQIANAEYRIGLSAADPKIEQTGSQAEHEYYQHLRTNGHPGLVLFTSGSSGPNKAAVHDVSMLLKKFETPRQQLRTLVFLQMDHIGGINTLLYTFSNGGTVIVARERTPRDVCEVIEQHRVELLPTSPTFLNLLLLSGEAERRDFSSLKVITYGTESMPESTLTRLADTLPDVRLQQTYGMTELGILRSKSRDSRSLWVRVGGDGFETKIVNDRLWVRAQSAMLGYLNAPSAYDEEGFLDTGDRVEVEGDWIKILGRDDETINVGGSKVMPAEVENILLQLEGVSDVVVSGESHPITGQIVAAVVRLSTAEPLIQFKVRARRHCLELLPTHAVPSRFKISDQPLHSPRFKRMR